MSSTQATLQPDILPQGADTLAPYAPSRMYIDAGPFVPKLEFAFRVKMDSAHHHIHFDFRDISTLQLMLRPFESVHIERIVTTIAATANEGGVIEYGVNNDNNKPSHGSNCPVYDFFGTGKYGMAKSVFSYEPNVRFGREIKAPYLGNAPPTIHVWHSGLTDGQYVLVNLLLEVSVHGNGPPIVLGSIDTGASSADLDPDIFSLVDPDEASAEETTEEQ